MKPFGEKRQYIGAAQVIHDAIKRVMESLGVLVGEIHLEHPANQKHGDYATNVAMATFEQSKVYSLQFKVKNPREFAQKIVNRLQADKKLKEFVDKIEVAGGGFINFWLAKSYLVAELSKIVKQGDSFGRSRLMSGKKYLLEHTSPNTIKTLHLGHLRNNCLGMAVYNLLEFVGVQVNLDALNNDRGIHVVKANWAYLQYGKFGQTLMLRKPRGYWPDLLKEWFNSQKKGRVFHEKLWSTPHALGMKGDHFVDQFYVLGVKAENEFNKVKEEMQQMLQAWEAKDPPVWALWQQLRDWTFAGFLKTYQRLGSHHDKQWFESDFYEKGKQTVLAGVKKGVFTKLPDGAVLSKLDKYHLPNAIILRADQTSMYHTQDLYLTKLKRQKFPADLYIWDIGPEQTLYLKQLFAMCEQLGIGKAHDYFHLSYGYVYLKGQGKMSSRAGKVISIDWLIEETARRAATIIEASETGRGLSQEEKKEVAEAVGLGAIKYGFLKVNRSSDIYFDIEESLSLEGDSGPYLQYTYARCQSVLRRSKMSKGTRHKSNLDINSEELGVLRLIYRFAEIVQESALYFAPNLVCSFLFELTQRYNSFYHKHPILKAKTTELKNFRLLLTAAVAQVVKNGLFLLRIKALEKM